jgi:hypothetical protein
MIRRLVATVTSGALIGGCGAAWPNKAAGLARPEVHRIETIDVLPVDLEVWTENGYPQPPEAVRDAASNLLLTSAVEVVQNRQYAIDGLIDWNGAIDGRGEVMPAADVDATIATLAHYDEVAGRYTLHLPDPHLPSKLGQVSGADATLYIGGWGYVAAHHDSTGEKIAEGVLIGVAVIAVVAIVAIALSGSHGGGSHGGGSHGGGGGGSHGGGGGRGHAAPIFHDHRTVATTDSPQFASIVVHDHRSTEGLAPIVRDHRGGDVGVHVSESRPTRVDTAIDIVDDIDVSRPEHPDWSGDVPQGEDPEMYVEMTLVDNATGLVVWHAHQKFPASAASKDDLARVARTMLASLPGR